MKMTRIICKPMNIHHARLVALLCLLPGFAAYAETRTSANHSVNASINDSGDAASEMLV